MFLALDLFETPLQQKSSFHVKNQMPLQSDKVTPTHINSLTNGPDFFQKMNQVIIQNDNLLCTPNMTNDIFLNFFGLPQF